MIDEVEIQPRPRVLLVGEDNPLSDDAEHALYCWPEGCSGWRLRRILGLTEKQYLTLDRTNLCSPRWNGAAAIARAAVLVAHDSPYRVIVMLGRKVTGAFRAALGLHEMRVWSVTKPDNPLSPSAGQPGITPLTLVSLPHPSGNCREWSHAGAVARARAILREVAPHVPWGEV